MERAVSERRLFGPGQKILVAVSGGLDSMALLHVLHQLAKEHGWHLVVAHFNHQLRGRSSDADERFVRQAARRLKLPLVAGRADVKRFARRQKLSVEMAARRLRHDFLARAARKRKISTVALGHHADDQVELFFLRLLRGTGGEGLTGMKWKSPSSSDAAVTLVRPLLGCSKRQIQDFAESEKICFREDKTNAALDFLRNRFRHELLPLLVRHYQPALSKTTLRLMEMLEAESEFITESAKAWLDKQQPPFEELPVAVQRRALQLQLFRLGWKADFERVEHLRRKAGDLLTLKPGLSVLRDEAGMVRIRDTKVPEFDAKAMELKLEGQKGQAEFGPLKITWEIAASHAPFAASGKAGSRPCCEYFDADKVGSTIALRHWQPGDRFRPIGMQSSVKLQDLFSDLKIPRARRHQLAIAATASGQLFWVEGLRISEQFKLDKGTVRRLNWCWQTQSG